MTEWCSGPFWLVLPMVDRPPMYMYCLLLPEPWGCVHQRTSDQHPDISVSAQWLHQCHLDCQMSHQTNTVSHITCCKLTRFHVSVTYCHPTHKICTAFKHKLSYMAKPGHCHDKIIIVLKQQISICWDWLSSGTLCLPVLYWFCYNSESNTLWSRTALLTGQSGLWQI